MQVRWVKWQSQTTMWLTTVKTAEQMESFYVSLYFSFSHGCSIMARVDNMKVYRFFGYLTSDNPIERINFYMICNKELPFNSIIYTLNPISQVIIFSYHMFPWKNYISGPLGHTKCCESYSLRMPPPRFKKIGIGSYKWIFFNAN